MPFRSTCSHGVSVSLAPGLLHFRRPDFRRPCFFLRPCAAVVWSDVTPYGTIPITQPQTTQRRTTQGASRWSVALLGLCLGCVSAGSGSSPPPSPTEALEAPVAPPRPAPSPGATSQAQQWQPRASARSQPSLDIPAIDQLVSVALAERKMPGCVIVIGRQSGVLFHRAYGQRALVPAPAPMTEDTIFDIASLTKAMVTATLLQKLIEQRQLRLDDRVARHLPEFAANGKGEVTVRQLLLHTAGLPIVNPLSDYAAGPAAGLARVFEQKLEAAPGQKYVYGDLGYITLGALLERVTGERLDQLARREIFEPLGMWETGYLPPISQRFRIAPTEIAQERPIPLIHGEAHDPRAWLLGGVAGNAGVFATADDVARFARMMLGEGVLDGVRILSRASVQEL
ncbi:MAG: hypothetical protein RL685_3165, partial [Pseudomonadota bacterium]